MRRTRLVQSVVLLLGAIVIGACAPMQVETYVPQSARLDRDHTFGWALQDDFSTGDPRLDNNTIFTERLQLAVERQLANKGWSKTTPELADLLIHYHVRIDQRVEVTDEGGVDGAIHGTQGRAFTYDAGTLVLDFLQAPSHVLAWRGWTDGSVDGVIDDQTWMNKSIDAAVTRILKTFPPCARERTGV